MITESCKTVKNSQMIIEYINKIEDWSAFVSLSHSHGVFPLVYRTLKEYVNFIPANIITHMKLMYMNIVKQNILMTSELIKVVRILEENNIVAIPFKGPILSKLAYGDIISRQYCDLDILINHRNKKKVVKILELLGYKLDDNISNNLNIDLFDVITVFNPQKAVSIEFHWRLLSINYAVDILKINIFNESSTINFFNNEIKVFNLEFLLVYLSLHASKHFFERISWICDIHLLISKNELDWDKFIYYVKLLKVERIIAVAIYISFLMFRTKIPIELNTLIYDDNKVKKIAIEIINLDDKSERINFNSLLLLLKQRSKLLNKIELAIKLIFYPKETDFFKINIPKHMKLLFIVIRPVRIILKYFSRT